MFLGGQLYAIAFAQMRRAVCQRHRSFLLSCVDALAQRDTNIAFLSVRLSVYLSNADFVLIRLYRISNFLPCRSFWFVNHLALQNSKE